MIVEKRKFITRKYVQENRHKAFIFGDNMQRKGLGGQAKHMRGEKNSFGIPTKWEPSEHEDAFFTNADFKAVKSTIDRAFRDIWFSDLSIVVIPQDGIGTGLAQLDKRAPVISKYIESKIKQLYEQPNKNR